MDVPCLFETWEILLDNTLLASIVTVATPCQGFEAQHGLIFSCFVDTLLLIVPHGHTCKFKALKLKYCEADHLDMKS